MFRWWKFGLVTVSAGALVGLSVVGWLYWHKPVSVAEEKPGTVSWPKDPVVGGGGRSSGDLSVTTQGDQGTALGQQIGGSQGSSGSAGGADASSGSGGDGLPTPSQFGMYEKYKNNPTALYIDVQPGDGKAVDKGSVVTMQYRGWLTNGKEFDESYARGNAYTFTEGDSNVISGVSEAMFGMKAGGRRRLIIPPTVGYGAAGHDPVPPDAVMVFDVELVSVK